MTVKKKKRRNKPLTADEIRIRAKKCPNCGKDILFINGSIYKARKGPGSYTTCCSWSCARAMDRKYFDKLRNKVYRDDGHCGGEIARDRLMIEPKESHTLEEWADLYGIDFYELAERVGTARLNVTDAVYLALYKKGDKTIV